MNVWKDFWIWQGLDEEAREGVALQAAKASQTSQKPSLFGRWKWGGPLLHLIRGCKGTRHIRYYTSLLSQERRGMLHSDITYSWYICSAALPLLGYRVQKPTNQKPPLQTANHHSGGFFGEFGDSSYRRVLWSGAVVRSQPLGLRIAHYGYCCYVMHMFFECSAVLKQLPEDKDRLSRLAILTD